MRKLEFQGFPLRYFFQKKNEEKFKEIKSSEKSVLQNKKPKDKQKKVKWYQSSL